MPTLLQRFLANAQRALIPSAQQAQGIDSLLSSVVPTIATDQQARPVEFDFLSATNVALARRIFTIARQVDDSISLYHHLALNIGATAGAIQEWRVSVEYPGMPVTFVVVRANQVRMDDDPLTGTPAAGDFIRQTTRTDQGVERIYSLTHKPFFVWPGGVVRVYSELNIPIGGVTILGYMRELYGVPADQSIRTGSLTATEV